MPVVHSAVRSSSPTAVAFDIAFACCINTLPTVKTLTATPVAIVVDVVTAFSFSTGLSASCLQSPRSSQKRSKLWPKSCFVRPSATSSEPFKWTNRQTPPGTEHDSSMASLRIDALILKCLVLHDEHVLPCARPIAAMLSP